MNPLRRAVLSSLCLAVLPFARAGWTPSNEAVFTGPANSSWAKAVAADGKGSVYVAGYSSDGFAYQAWIARYSEDLVLLSSAVTSGSQAGGINYFNSLSLDADGNVCAAGTIGNAGTGQDFFAKRYTAALAPLPGVYLSGPAAGDEAYGVACDPSSLYAAGTISADVVVIRFAAATPTVVISSTAYDGPAFSRDEAHAILLDGPDHVLVGGGVTNGAGGMDLWLARFNANTMALEDVFTLDGPGSGDDVITGLAFGPGGDIFATGYVTGSNNDIWVGRFAPDLTLRDSAILEGPDKTHDFAGAISIDGRGNLYLGGYVNGNVPSASGGGDSARDYYLARLSPSSLGVLSQSVVNGSGNNIDQVGALALDGKGNLYAAGILYDNVTGPNAWVAKYSIAGDILSLPTDSVRNVKVYPSPFRPARGDAVVAIANLPAGAEVSLYTMTGETVARFTADDQGGVAWDGKNAAGNPAASGVYFGVASGRGGSKTFKVVVQR